MSTVLSPLAGAMRGRPTGARPRESDGSSGGDVEATDPVIGEGEAPAEVGGPAGKVSVQTAGDEVLVLADAKASPSEPDTAAISLTPQLRGRTCSGTPGG
jgi:hypothetical protein